MFKWPLIFYGFLIALKALGYLQFSWWAVLTSLLWMPLGIIIFCTIIFLILFVFVFIGITIEMWFTK